MTSPLSLPLRTNSRKVSKFTVTMAGTASAMPVRHRNQSAQVLDVHGRLFLVDCGEGVQGTMVRLGIPFVRLDSIFISHIHGDHIFGLFALLSTLGMGGRTKPLNIFAPVNFGPILKFFLSYFGDGLLYEIKYTPLKMKEPETILSGRSFEVLAFPLNHKIDTFGYIFREKDPLWNVHKWAIERYNLTLTEIGSLKRGEDIVREDGSAILVNDVCYKKYTPVSYAYCSDTAPFPEEASWLKGVTVLYHETTYIESFADQASKRFHSTTLQAARCALEAGAGKLLIGHFSSRETDASLYEAECRTIFPDTRAVSDGDIIVLRDD